MKTSYYTLNGSILYERRNASVMSYAPDAVGSVIMTIEATAISRRLFYSPFGRLVSGDRSSLSFAWLGTHGYRAEERSGGSHYVRNRWYGSELVRWVTLDPFWPIQPAFTYARNDPTTGWDEDGLCDLPNPSQCGMIFSTYVVTGIQKKKQDPTSILPKPTKKFGVYLGYANFCGGDRNPLKEFPKAGKKVPNPINDGGVDNCCKEHDKRYNDYGCDWNTYKDKWCFAADEIMCICLKVHECKLDSPADKKECNKFRSQAIKWFCYIKPTTVPLPQE